MDSQNKWNEKLIQFHLQNWKTHQEWKELDKRLSTASGGLDFEVSAFSKFLHKLFSFLI